VDAATIALIIQFALKYGPDAAAKLQKIFAAPTVSQQDWDDLFAAAKKHYEDYTGGPVPPA
jgi:hypothetical protein